jgi:NAD(P)-dependent dehydrogenase (short-subunit alcohol dehydrogenase family)
VTLTRSWLITGATRGIGLHLAQAALAHGDRVIATSRRREDLIRQLGPDSEQLLSVALDVTNTDQVRTGVDAALARFGTPDVLVNNAGYGHYGFFEELNLADAREQFETNFFGVLNMTWAVLPSMRAAGRGRLFNISSLGGLLAGQTGSMYCASKFALEGFSESLAREMLPFGIFVTIVEPGPFRTDFLTPQSLQQRHTPLAVYDVRRAEFQAGVEDRHGHQPGDPRRLAQAIIQLAGESSPPLRFVAGSIALDATLGKLDSVRAEIDQWRDLAVSTDGGGRDNLDANSILKTVR